MTAVGVLIRRFLMTTAKAAMTMSSSRKMTMRKRFAPRLPM
jgi:hypothetical protein